MFANNEQQSPSRQPYKQTQIIPTPGYAGHMPFKNDIVGLTMGETHKSCMNQWDLQCQYQKGNLLGLVAQQIMSSRASSNANNSLSYRSNSVGSLAKSNSNEHNLSLPQISTNPYENSANTSALLNPYQNAEDKSTNSQNTQKNYKLQKQLIIGNNSRHAPTWLGGPRHEIRDQRLPGYAGFMPGMNSDNLFGKSYAKCSAASLKNKLDNLNSSNSSEKRYQSVNQRAFASKNFRRIVADPDLASKKDYLEYTLSLNIFDSKSSNYNLTALTVFQSPSNSKSFILNPNIPSLQLNQPNMKPILLEKKLAKMENFRNLGEGFKKIFLEQDDLTDQENLVIPITGYTGHRKGLRVQNIYGKSSREASLVSKRLEREPIIVLGLSSLHLTFYQLLFLHFLSLQQIVCKSRHPYLSFMFVFCEGFFVR
eukprot:403345653